MPLISGSSRSVISNNIRTESKYKPHNQAVAIALSNARRHPRASGGSNYPQMPSMINPTVAQIAAHLPRSGYTPQAGFGGHTSGQMPNAPMPAPGQRLPPVPMNRVPLPQHKPPVPQFNRGINIEPDGVMPHYAGGGATANSSIPALTADEATKHPTLAPATPLAQPTITPQPYASSVANVPMSALSGGAGSNGIVAPVSSQGIPLGQPGMPTMGAAQSSLAMQPAPNPAAAAASQTPATMSVNSPSGNFQVPQTGSFTEWGPNNSILYFNAEDPTQQFITGASGNGPPIQISNPYYKPSANGGAIPQFAAGGAPQMSQMSPWWTRSEAKDELHTGGLFGGHAPGRADTLPRDVPVSSYVIPADIVAAIGQGNTLSGGSILDGMFNTRVGPYGIAQQAGRSGGHTIPKPPAPAHDFAGGRKQGHGSQTIPIAASSGEYLVKPEAVARLGGGDMKRGFSVLDAFVKKTREKHIKTLKGLPGPKRD